MHTPGSLIDIHFTERQLWSRILSEADEASAEDAFLAPVIAECISQSAGLPAAIINRIATLLSPPLSASLRIPMKPDGYSDAKPDRHSNLMPDAVPI